MTDFDTNDTVVDDAIDTEVDTGGSDDVVTDADNPWAWADGLDPQKIAKTWNGYTKNQQELAKEKEELTPIAELRDEIMGNPELQAHLRKFYENQANGVDPTAKELATLKEKMQGLESQITVKAETAELEKYVKDEGLPTFEADNIIAHAAKNGFSSLKAAYRDLMFDDIRQSAEDGAYDKIKQTMGAAIPKVGNADKRSNKTFSSSDLETMSDEDFEKNYSAIQRQMSKGL